MKTRIKRHRFHAVCLSVLKFLLGWILKRIYAFKTDRPKSIKGPFLVLANHVTAVDPLLLNLSFRDQMYIVASEHLMQKGLPSKLLKLLFDPIVRRKGDSAVTAVKEMLACLKAGFNVCVFPEGTCSYDGTNSPMLPTIGKLAKTSGCTLVTYRFEGGYFTLPRWGRGIRRGSYCGHIVNVYAPETLSAMSASEVNAAIEDDLSENAYARIETSAVSYRSRCRAEYLESAFFLCPACRRVGTIETKGDAIRCSCGLSGGLDGRYRLSGLPFGTLTEWDAFQNEWLKTTAADPAFSFSDGGVTLYQNDDKHRRIAIASGTMTMTRDALSVGDRTFALSDVTDVELVRRNLLVFSTHDAHYQIGGAKPLNTRKYMQLYRINKGVK